MGIHSFPTILDPILNDFSESGADSSTFNLRVSGLKVEPEPPLREK